MVRGEDLERIGFIGRIFELVPPLSFMGWETFVNRHFTQRRLGIEKLPLNREFNRNPSPLLSFNANAVCGLFTARTAVYGCFRCGCNR